MFVQQKKGNNRTVYDFVTVWLQPAAKTQNNKNQKTKQTKRKNKQTNQPKETHTTESQKTKHNFF